MGSDGQSIGREIAGVDVGAFERAIAGADRDSLCRAMAAMRASFEGANRVDAVCTVAEPLRALFVRGQLDHRRLDEDVFLETIRTASLRSDCSGAFEVLEQFRPLTNPAFRRGCRVYCTGRERSKRQPAS